MKEIIIKKIKAVQEIFPLPDLDHFCSKKPTDTGLLKSRVEESNCSYLELPNIEDVGKIIKGMFPESNLICDVTNKTGIGNLDPKIKDKTTLAQLDLCIVEAKFIVEENGAIWLTEEDIKNRILLCIAENLIVLVDKKSIIGNMQDAYKQIINRNYNYGVFVCGPSKTADIAQTLVIGAHGPKTMTIILY